jgi:hypothetical protein
LLHRDGVAALPLEQMDQAVSDFVAADQERIRAGR